MLQSLPPSVRSLAGGDFTRLAQVFARAGFAVATPAPGILEITRPGEAQRPRVFVSVGIHGDETAPIEILAGVLDRLGADAGALRVDLLLAVGNVDAIAAGERFIDADLNRMFRPERGDLANAREAARADVLMQAAAAFFGSGRAANWHLDLHTAIRPSHFPAFAVVPQADDPQRDRRMLGWLGRAGIDAAILNRSSAGTFSAWTAAQFDAAASTVELGQVAALGTNDLGRFADAGAALDALMRHGGVEQGGRVPPVFEVVQELVKRSDAFRMHIGAGAQNFTALAPGSVIAEDGEHAYRVGQQTEYIVFPNPNVRVGLRAGLMVVRRG